MIPNLSRIQSDADDERLESTQTTLERMDRILQQVLQLARTGEANTDALVELFECLLENAVHYGGRNVTVRVGIREDRSGFFVADDGPGIDPDDRMDLFDTSYTDRPENRGYGLHVTSAIVEAHGWTISVSESADGGARFDITGLETQ